MKRWKPDPEAAAATANATATDNGTPGTDPALHVGEVVRLRLDGVRVRLGDRRTDEGTGDSW